MDGTTKVEYSVEKRYIAFVDAATRKPRLVYLSPIARFASGKTSPVGIDWDSSSSSIILDLPNVLPPLVLAFGVGLHIPDPKTGFGFSFPSFKFGTRGEVEAEESSSDEEVKEKPKKKAVDVSVEKKEKGPKKISGFKVKSLKFCFFTTDTS